MYPLTKKEFFDGVEYPIQTKENLIISTQVVQPLPHQEFLSRYMAPATPYKSILVIHETGVGKTCTAISIAEQYKHLGKKIIILCSASVRNNFENTIFDIQKQRRAPAGVNVQCTVDEYLPIYENAINPEFAIDKEIKKWYSFFGYKEFRFFFEKTFEKTNLQQIKEYFSDILFIIDEIQNIKTLQKEYKVINHILELIVDNADNLKLVMMSATPMYNESYEILFYIDLCRKNDRKPLQPRTHFFDSKNNLINSKEFYEYSRGYISYMKAIKHTIFPIKLISKESLIPKYEYDIKMKKVTPMQFLKLHFVDISQSKIKDYYHRKISKIKTFDNDIYENDENDENAENTVTMKLKQILNIVFPKEGNEVTYGMRGYIQKDKLKKKGCIIEGNGYFKYTNNAFVHGTPFLDLKNLKMYSPKFHEIITTIIQSQGIAFVYSDYLYSGVYPFAMALEQNGIKRYKGKGTGNILDSHQKRPAICFICRSPHLRDKEYDYDHELIEMKYVILNSSEDTKRNWDEYLRVLKDTSNKDGQQIKIIVGNKTVSEGVDFSFIRQIFIIEPWYNLSRLNQIMGRGIRRFSHSALEPQFRNTEIFLISAVDTTIKNETVDLSLYRKMERKEKQIKEVLRVLKRSAIDCYLNRNVNIYMPDFNFSIITPRGDHLTINTKSLPFQKW